MPQELDEALADLRPLLLDLDHLVRAVGAGHRRNARPAHLRVELRPVDLRGGRRLQVVLGGEGPPVTRNHPPGEAAEREVTALLAEPFGNWHVETHDRVVQLRVTKRGQAQVHISRTSRRDVAPARHDRVRQHLLDPADPLFAVLGADADKRRQVDAFLRQLASVLEPVAAAAAAADRPVRVVDLGCGNAYLTFAAHRWLSQQFPEVGTVGVDLRPDAVRRNTGLAAELGLTGMSFVAGSIDDVGLAQVAGPPEPAGEPAAEPASRVVPPPDRVPETVDLVLALHACDTATDQALARAVHWGAAVVLAAPCCHHDLQRQLTDAPAVPEPYQPLVRHPILRERFADVLTDALRAEVLRMLGYRTEVVEFVDSRHTPRNALVRAVRTGAPPSSRRVREYLDLTAAWGVRPAVAVLLAPELDPVLAGPAGESPAR